MTQPLGSNRDLRDEIRDYWSDRAATFATRLGKVKNKQLGRRLFKNISDLPRGADCSIWRLEQERLRACATILGMR